MYDRSKRHDCTVPWPSSIFCFESVFVCSLLRMLHDGGAKVEKAARCLSDPFDRSRSAIIYKKSIFCIMN